MNIRERNRAVLLAVLALVWFGVLAGVSFLATPVKFLAPSLSLPVALDVGRQTFAALNLLELVLALAVLVATIFQHRSARETAPRTSGQTQGQVTIGVVLIALVLWQTLWLLPVLDSRVEIILQGDSPPASSLHLFYIGVDALKLLLLGLVAGTSLARLRQG